MKPGKFIVFEGIDGSGKGTQLKRCAQFLFDLDKEYDVYMTREPTRDFKEIRASMAAGQDVKDKCQWYAEMFVKDRTNHLAGYIEPALHRGTHVVCDRYKHSTLAYQHTQGMDLDQLIKMHEGLRVPDLTLIFDCDVSVAFQRRQADGATDVFEKDAAFQERLRHTYLGLKDKLVGENIVVVRSDRSIGEVTEEVQRHVRQVLQLR